MSEEFPEHSIELEIRNEAGLHARPAAELVKLTSRYSADVWLSKEGLEVNAKSIMGVLMLAAEQGSLITVRARGEDSKEAVDAVSKLIAEQFGES